MELNEIIKLEPINITAVIIFLIIMFFFKTQLTGFFEGLRERPFKVVMDGSTLSFDFDAHVTPLDTVKGIFDPIESDTYTIENWAEKLDDVTVIGEFEKAGFAKLHQDISNLNENEIAVLNYEVSNPNKTYFKDNTMLKYLSIASEKFRYLAFYENGQFKAYIKTEKVIKGLASGDNRFKNFGEKLKTNNWHEFSGLIQKSETFSQVPTIQQLYDKLELPGVTEVALIEQEKLKSILNYETISNALYQQKQQ